MIKLHPIYNQFKMKILNGLFSLLTAQCFATLVSFTHSHTHIHPPMANAAMQGATRLIRSNFGLSILLNDNQTSSWGIMFSLQGLPVRFLWLCQKNTGLYISITFLCGYFYCLARRKGVFWSSASLYLISEFCHIIL